MTPNSAAVPYCTAAFFLVCYSRGIAADLLRAPDSPRPSYLAMLDQTNPAGEMLFAHLCIGAGEIESRCAIGKRYMPEHLQSLTGVSSFLLSKLNAARGMWSLYQTLKPGSARPEDVPMARESDAMLSELEAGQRIFTFLEAEQAGLPTIGKPMPSQLETPNTLQSAIRLFPNYGYNRQIGGGT